MESRVEGRGSRGEGVEGVEGVFEISLIWSILQSIKIIMNRNHVIKNHKQSKGYIALF